MRRRRLLALVRRWVRGALLLSPAIACGGLDAPKLRDPVDVPDDGDPPVIPPPILHAPMVHLEVEVFGPSIDAPVNVFDVSVDQGGGIWLASEQGLFVRPPGEAFFRGLSTTDGLPPVHVRSVGGLGAGEAIVGFRGEPPSLVRLRRSSSAIDATALPKLGEVFRVEIREGPEGRLLLLAASNGLGVVGGDGTLRGLRTLPAPSGDLGDVAATPHGDVWIGDPHRLIRLTGPVDQSLAGELTPEVDLVPDAPDDVVAVTVCPDTSVWASALGHGVFRVSAEGKILDHLHRENHLPQDHVPSLACDLDGSLWIGTSWGGLARRLPDGGFRYHGVAAGLPGDSIRRLVIVPDGNGKRTLWIATEGGAAAYRGP